MERKPIPKKLRFEVFKRDRFACQYCGRMSPDVILEVDHIKPVVEGGENDILNLVTACRDCNRGKGKTQLCDDTVIKKQQKQLIELAEKKEQNDMMILWKKELLKITEDQIDSINDLVFSITGWELSNVGKRDIRKYLKEFSFQEVYDATETSFGHYYDDTSTDQHASKSFNLALSKIGGICYNNRKVRENGTIQNGQHVILDGCEGR